MEKKLQKITGMHVILFLLVIHLFGVHSKILYYLILQVNDIDPMAFSYLKISEPLVQAIIYALAYSLLTALLIALFKFDKPQYIIIAGVLMLLDSFGVLLIYTSSLLSNFILYGGIYYAIYTAMIFTGVIVQKTLTQKSETPIHIAHNKSDEEKVIELYQNGLFNSTIANQLDIPHSKVGRILNRYNNIKKSRR